MRKKLLIEIVMSDDYVILTPFSCVTLPLLHIESDFDDRFQPQIDADHYFRITVNVKRYICLYIYANINLVWRNFRVYFI